MRTDRFRNIVIKTDSLSTLTCVEVISFYDYPRIFVAESDKKHLYVLAEYKSDVDVYSWVACEVDENDILLLDKESISIQQVFSNSEQTFIISIARGSDVANCIEQSNLPGDCFVDEPLYLGHFISNDVQEEHIETVKKIRLESNSTVISFRTRRNRTSFLSVDVEEIKNLIEKFTKFFSSFGYKNKQSLSLAKGSTLVNFIIEDSDDEQLNGVDEGSATTFASTFEEMVEAKDEQDLMRIPKITKAKIETFKGLFDVMKDEAGESEIIFAPKGKNPSVANKTKEERIDFAKIIDSTLDKIKRQDSIQILRMHGILNGILTIENKFEFTSEDGENFKGKLSDSIDTNGTYLVNGNEYSVVIEKKKAGNGKIVYSLLSVGEPTKLF